MNSTDPILYKTDIILKGKNKPAIDMEKLTFEERQHLYALLDKAEPDN